MASAAGADADALAEAGDRGSAVEAMARGAAAVVKRLHGEGRLDGIASVGGSGDPAAAPEPEQDRRAAVLLARSGRSQWPVCGR